MRFLRYLLFILFSHHLVIDGQLDISFPKSGFYDAPFAIKPPVSCNVKYTKQGLIPREPLAKEIVVSETTQFIFTVKQDEINLDTTFSRTYIFDYSSKFPALSIAIETADLWNDSVGIYCRGRNAFFNDSTKHWENCNYQKKWERTIWATYLTNDEIGFDQQAGIRLFGESTRRNPDKSFKIAARKKYGKSYFKHPLFKQKKTRKFKQLVIRTSGNDFKNTRFKDVLSTHLVSNLDIDYMAYQPIQLFINGEHWGLYNLREKINKHYISTNYSIPEDSINIIMGRWIRQEGSATHYMLMYRFFENIGNMTDANYKIAQQFLDIRNYINYRVFQIFINNKDSRGNIRYWNAPGYQDKFRMILYDTDLGYSNPSFNYLEGCLSREETAWYNPTWSTMYLTKLIEHPSFKTEFIQQFSHLLNTALHRDSIIGQIDYLQMLYYGELPTEKTKRPTHLKSVIFPMEKWNNHVQELREFAAKRGDFMKIHLKKAFNLGGEYILKINGEVGKINIADNYAQELPFSGNYFKELTLKLEALDVEGYTFKGWSDGEMSSVRYIEPSSDTVYLEILYDAIKEKDELSDHISTGNETLLLKREDHKKVDINKILTLLGLILLIIGVVILTWSFFIKVE
jgi:hypothetical protein